MANKLVYFFGGGKADGRADMKNLLGGKGANLAEMAGLGIPVPAGFTITTEVCTFYTLNKKKYPPELEKAVDTAIRKTEKIMGAKFGDPKNPLLLSVRSGARVSMPGMMETVLNVGLTSKTMQGLIDKSGNEWFVWDAYRRLIMMYSDVVMEKGTGAEVEHDYGIRVQLDEIMDELKEEKGYNLDTEMQVEDLQYLCDAFKKKVKQVLGKPFPDDHKEQLWGGISAVFASWMGKRAVSYRRIEGVPVEWGTAVNVQAMVFGNMGDSSATGVAFTRNPATGENWFFGEWLVNAQGEDVVAGLRTPNALNKRIKSDTNKDLPSLEEAMPKLYKELDGYRNKLEKHYKNMQDLEFTIQEGKLWMLQTRNGKRNGPAALMMAVDMCKEGLITKEEAITRVTPAQLDELLHPMVDPLEEKNFKPFAKGLPAGPGGAVGQIVFSPDRAEEQGKAGAKVILVRNETSPEDVHGMHAAEAILTARGGMTSHAALVARGWGKCCIVGCAALKIDYKNRQMEVDGQVFKEGDTITLNGTKGVIYAGTLPLKVIDPGKNKDLATFLSWADEIRAMGVRANAETPEDAAQAIEFGAEGIGLARTEHMFFDPARILYVREMILAENEEKRRAAIMKLLPFQKDDFLGIFKAMAGKPVTVRLLDPPLHEFVGSLVEHGKATPELKKLSKDINIPEDTIIARIEALHEFNPMLGHRGCRLGIVYPEITEMQARAILEATAELTQKKIKVLPEIMIPLIGTVQEFKHQKDIVMRVAADVKKEYGIRKLDFMVGTMIEVPRAALTADLIAAEAEFFSFGTNDLTQMACGFSRDDAGTFLPFYVEHGMYKSDPFQELDQEGVGQLVAMGVDRGRATRPDLKCGICGEHGGDPSSIDFCHRVGLNYVSCSPFRIPIARLSAAQAQLANPRNTGKAKKAAPKKAAKK